MIQLVPILKPLTMTKFSTHASSFVHLSVSISDAVTGDKNTKSNLIFSGWFMNCSAKHTGNLIDHAD